MVHIAFSILFRTRKVFAPCFASADNYPVCGNTAGYHLSQDLFTVSGGKRAKEQIEMMARGTMTPVLKSTWPTAHTTGTGCPRKQIIY